MPNYQDGKIYKIVCIITDECYIGSTCEPTVVRRLATHVRSFKSSQNTSKGDYVTSYGIIGRGDYQIFLIENYSCNSRDELHSREGEIIREFKLNCKCNNFYIPGRTYAQYRKDNCDIIREKKKQHYDENKELYSEKYKKYHADNKTKLNENCRKYNAENKERISEKHKNYREENKDKIKEIGKAYNEKNKEQILLKQKVKIECVCGSCICKHDKAKHERSKKHQNYIDSLQSELG